MAEPVGLCDAGALGEAHNRGADRGQVPVADRPGDEVPDGLPLIGLVAGVERVDVGLADAIEPQALAVRPVQEGDRRAEADLGVLARGLPQRLLRSPGAHPGELVPGAERAGRQGLVADGDPPGVEAG